MASQAERDSIRQTYVISTKAEGLTAVILAMGTAGTYDPEHLPQTTFDGRRVNWDFRIPHNDATTIYVLGRIIED